MNKKCVALTEGEHKQSSPVTTRRYITISRHRIEQALEKTADNLI